MEWFDDGPLWVDAYLVHVDQAGRERVYALRAHLFGEFAPEAFKGMPVERRRLHARRVLERSQTATRKVLEAGQYDESVGIVKYPDSAYTPDVIEAADGFGLMVEQRIGLTPPFGRPPTSKP